MFSSYLVLRPEGEERVQVREGGGWPPQAWQSTWRSLSEKNSARIVFRYKFHCVGKCITLAVTSGSVVVTWCVESAVRGEGRLTSVTESTGMLISSLE